MTPLANCSNGQASYKPTLSIITASRTQPAQLKFLQRCISSVRRQNEFSHYRISFIIAVDKNEGFNLKHIACSPDTHIVESKGNSQAEALNAAIDSVGSELIAFLEDDDEWCEDFLTYAGEAIKSGAKFVSSTQLELDENDNIIRINDFATPSGWFMPLQTLKLVGHFNKEYRFHLDSEWLGRLGDMGLVRYHLIESTAPLDPGLIAQVRPWLFNVLKLGGAGSVIARHALPVPLVKRLVHRNSGMGQISHNEMLRQISLDECCRLNSRFGRMPW